MSHTALAEEKRKTIADQNLLNIIKAGMACNNAHAFAAYHRLLAALVLSALDDRKPPALAFPSLLTPTVPAMSAAAAALTPAAPAATDDVLKAAPTNTSAGASNPLLPPAKPRALTARERLEQANKRARAFAPPFTQLSQENEVADHYDDDDDDDDDSLDDEMPPLNFKK